MSGEPGNRRYFTMNNQPLDKQPQNNQTQKKRQLLAVVFVALCLSLSGLLLHRQMAAHPAPLEAATHLPAGFLYPGTESAAQFAAPKFLHTATGPVQKAVIHSITAQLAAIRAGDADKAIFYQSTGLRRNFPTPQAFVQSITIHYPEFGHSRSAQFGPMVMDTTADHAAVAVTVLGENGRWARGDYRMVKEEGVYKVAGVLGGNMIR